MRYSVLDVKHISLAVFLVAAPAFAQDPSRWEVKAAAWLAKPATLTAESSGFVDFRSPLGIGATPQFAGSAAYRIRPRHEVLVEYTPFRASGSAAAPSPIVFENTTFAQGATVSGRINVDLAAPEYQWNFVDGGHGYIGIRAGLQIMRASVAVSGPASFYEPHVVTTHLVALHDSVTAVLPVAGPAFQWTIPRTDRVNLNGCVKGAKIGGYDSYVDARLNVGVALARGFGIEVGYAFVQDARVEAAAGRLGIGFRSQGLLAGLTGRW